ncbi:MAG: hypothetical protein LCH81_15065 [Bacteroidetes bacterium]|nr:hypothetical protein [Bacteroidota bacterium]
MSGRDLCLWNSKGQKAKGKKQKARGKGQGAKGKGQRAKGKGQEAKGSKRQNHYFPISLVAPCLLLLAFCPLPFAPCLLPLASCPFAFHPPSKKSPFSTYLSSCVCNKGWNGRSSALPSPETRMPPPMIPFIEIKSKTFYENHFVLQTKIMCASGYHGFANSAAL